MLRNETECEICKKVNHFSVGGWLNLNDAGTENCEFMVKVWTDETWLARATQTEYINSLANKNNSNMKEPHKHKCSVLLQNANASTASKTKQNKRLILHRGIDWGQKTRFSTRMSPLSIRMVFLVQTKCEHLWNEQKNKCGLIPKKEYEYLMFWEKLGGGH